MQDNRANPSTVSSADGGGAGCAQGCAGGCLLVILMPLSAIFLGWIGTTLTELANSGALTTLLYSCLWLGCICAVITIIWRSGPTVIKNTTKFFGLTIDRVVRTPQQVWKRFAFSAVLALAGAAAWRYGPSSYQAIIRLTDKGAWSECAESARRAAAQNKFGEARDLHMHASAKAEKIGIKGSELETTIQELRHLRIQEAEHGFE